MNTLFDLDNPPVKTGYKFPKLSSDLCRRAFYWTSFDPDKRGDRFNEEYEAAQREFIAFVNAHSITDEQKADCLGYWTSRLHKNAEEYLCAESRCISWVITGPAKFPVKKAEKAQASAEAKINAYIYTLEQMKSPKIFERYLSPEQKQNRIDAQKWREISQTIEYFIDYKKGAGWFNAFPHLKGAFTTQAKNGNFAMCEKILEVLTTEKENGLKVAQNIQILTAILEEWKAKLAETKESTEQEINGVRIVENTEENRLQLFFDGKPAPEIISILKHNAFKWSPRFKAWQRILTPNAKFALNKILAEIKE